MSDTEAAVFLTTSEFARRVGMSSNTVKRMCDAGRIAHVYINPRGDRRIPASEVDRLLSDAEANRTEVDQ